MGMPRTSASVATRLGLSRLRCPAITHPDYEEYQSSESPGDESFQSITQRVYRRATSTSEILTKASKTLIRAPNLSNPLRTKCAGRMNYLVVRRVSTMNTRLHKLMCIAFSRASLPTTAISALKKNPAMPAVQTSHARPPGLDPDRNNGDM